MTDDEAPDDTLATGSDDDSATGATPDSGEVGVGNSTDLDGDEEPSAISVYVPNLINTRIEMSDLKRKAAAALGTSHITERMRLQAGDVGSFDAIKRMQEVAKSAGASGEARRLSEQYRAATKRATFNMPAVENLRRLQQDQDRRNTEMSKLTEDMVTSSREKWQREEDLANATLEIADAQGRLRELQEQGLELAVKQADATSQVVELQHQVLESINEELGLLRAQHVTLQEQVEGQKRLIHSGWSGGAVMEWTLFVAVIAAAATVTFAVQPATELDWRFWVSACVTFMALAAGLTFSQRKRRPSGE